VSDLFPQISAEDAWEKYRLSDDQVNFFREFGYLSGIKLLDDHQVASLNKELDEIKEPSHPGNHLFHEFHTNESTNPDHVLFHSLGHWRITSGFHDALWNPAFVVAASQLLENKPVRFWHDQLFYKPAHHGGVVAWHQDYSYWTRTKPMQHLTCWVALDDVSTENGCLYYVPKSQHWGLLDKPALAGDMNGINAFLNPEQTKEFAKKVPIEMKKGYGTFHHPLMVHGSYENKSARPRRAFVLNVFADETKSDSDGELLQGVPPIAKGKKMEGQFFPLLFDPGKV
ncbi:MAG: phytanoyl-CoA dioxygenase family protein, partial [Cyclobacteriaceae bacterium]